MRQDMGNHASACRSWAGAVAEPGGGTTLRRWSLSRAWPVKFVAGDWDNEADENVIESVTLSDDFFEFLQ